MLEQIERLQNASIREGPTRGSNAVDVPAQQLWKADVGNGIENVENITFVCAQQLDQRVSAWQRTTDDPTDTHRIAREELGHDVGAGGTTVPELSVSGVNF